MPSSYRGRPWRRRDPRIASIPPGVATAMLRRVYEQAWRERKDAMGGGLRPVPKLPPFQREEAFCQSSLQSYGAPFLAEFEAFH